jgi:hypothetical protein
MPEAAGGFLSTGGWLADTVRSAMREGWNRTST